MPERPHIIESHCPLSKILTHVMRARPSSITFFLLFVRTRKGYGLGYYSTDTEVQILNKTLQTVLKHLSLIFFFEILYVCSYYYNEQFD